MNLFPHLDLADELAAVEALAAEGLHVAHHADADGAIASALIGAMLEHPPNGYCQVTTEDIHLDPLVEWVRKEKVENLVTFDINVWSTRGALTKLSDAVRRSVRVIDDHLGEIGALPDKVALVQLLPPGERTKRKDQIRPAFLFADAVAVSSRRMRSGMQAFLALAGLYGEGVSHLFDLPGIGASRDVHRSAREFGRGVTAAYIALNSSPDDDHLVQGLVDLLIESNSDTRVDQAAQRALVSDIGNQVMEAAELVTLLVKKEVQGVNASTPWLSTETFDVYFVEVNASERIVNLVASETRSMLNSGIALAVQQVPSGIALELRRAKDLDAPNLVELLMELNGSMFISRGGHPMAAGATVVPGRIDDVIGALRDKLLR